ncbi:hypothetical protein QBC34DRAFT_310409 [Podospora aff. communis PSN243]|uniref:Uncharacterized protein n=1 Tax=Podospora aff. communis PSN243 TaxID=3040156 RepID=A0AAV9G5E2_9PEZI|nr:hypothetical protein QBC34DRAFT_310409 [Podospora aff. communis PSN243]
MQRETTVQFTASNGLLTTKTKIDVVWLKTTTYLAGVPPVMVAPYVQTVLNADGQPIATTTSFRDGIPLLVPTLTTLLDASGVPTATLRTSAAPTSRIVTLTNNLGIPIATQTQFPVIPLIPGAKPADDLFLLTDSSHSLYFAVYFLPILIAAILLIPIQVLDAEIRLLMPYRLLTRPGGTDAAEALCLSTRGFSGRLAGWKLLLRHREPLAVLSDGLSLCNTVLIALSGEAIGMRLRGHCHQQNVSTCMISLAAFPGPARAAQALMGTMMVLLVVMGRILARWRSGVAAHPASLASVCALLQVPGAVELLRKGVAPPSGRESLKAQDKLRGSWVRIGWAESDKRAEGYGLVFMREGARLALTRNTRIRSWDGWGEKRGKKVKLHVPVSERVNQGAFFGFLCGLLAMILYYQCTMYDDPSESAFEAFVDSQGFGVVALFSALGMLAHWTITLAFGATSIYLHISQRPQPAARSVLESRATNPFTRLWRALRRRDALTASIAVANILAKFLPMLLSGIPFKSTQTWQSQQICGWTTVALLAIMILVMLVYMRFARWPELPVSPDSLAGVVYYVCDSHMLKDFERLSMLGTRERDRRVERMARRYSFDWITGVSGERRIACDYAEGGQGFKLRSLGHLGFGVGGKMRPR